MKFMGVSRRTIMCLIILVVCLVFFNPLNLVKANIVNLPRFESSPCMFQMPLGAVEGKDITCGYLSVAEEHQKPNSPAIQLAVAMIKSTQPNPAQDPLVMAQGGPGGSTIKSFITTLFSTSKLRSNRDIILFDQRGTLYSKPNLICPELVDETINTLNKDLPLKEANRLYEEAAYACHNRLVKEGINLSAFDSYENAADIEDLRVALGYPKINLYGVSYGTLLALHTMQAFPQGLRSVVIDSVVPPQTNFILESPRSENRAFTQLFNACNSDPACVQSYPELEKVFFNLVDQFNQKPAHITITDPDNGKIYPAILTGDTFMGAIFQMQYSTEIIPLLPKVIFDAQSGQFDFLQRILSQLLIDRTMSYGMYYSVLCAEDADFSIDSLNLTGLRPQIAKGEEENTASFLRTCNQWGVESLGKQANLPVTSDVPTLVLNGEFDPITPPAFGKEAAATLINSFVVVFPAGGHGAAMSGNCQDQIILEFLDNPSKQPDLSCIQQNLSPDFITNKNTIFLPEIPKLANLEDGSGFQLLFLALGILFLLLAPGVWIITWIIRKLTHKPVPTMPIFAHILRWLVIIEAGSLLIFLVGLVVVTIRMALQNDFIILMGLSAAWRPLFILPALASIMSLGLMIGSVVAWLSRYWSIWNRIYFTLLAFTAFGCTIILAIWDMIFAIVK